ncbi:MAG: hypothetical protein KBT15_10320 [Bacteroidales bacterium]|nr:hypothetical protein [Candidatus Minthousia equi]
MKRLGYILTLLAAVCVFSSFTFEKKKPKADKPITVYMFGFSASFADSTVYFTDIQAMPNVKLKGKLKFLGNWSEYSYQLKNYLEISKGLHDRTCAIFYSESKEDAEKKFIKLRKRYSEQKNLVVRYLTTADFAFEKVLEIDIPDE